MPGPMKDPSPRVADRLGHRPRPISPPPLDDTTDSDTWTVAQLRARAAELGVAGRSRMRRAELVATLRGQLGRPSDDPDHRPN